MSTRGWSGYPVAARSRWSSARSSPAESTTVVVVDDQFALALHYNNLAFSDDMAGDERGAFAYPQEGNRIDARQSPTCGPISACSMRGAATSIRRFPDNRMALKLDPYHSAALSEGSPMRTARWGSRTRRAFYQRRVAYSRARDAYAYYTLAQRAYQSPNARRSP